MELAISRSSIPATGIPSVEVVKPEARRTASTSAWRCCGPARRSSVPSMSKSTSPEAILFHYSGRCQTSFADCADRCAKLIDNTVPSRVKLVEARSRNGLKWQCMQVLQSGPHKWLLLELDPEFIANIAKQTGFQLELG